MNYGQEECLHPQAFSPQHLPLAVLTRGMVRWSLSLVHGRWVDGNGTFQVKPQGRLLHIAVDFCTAVAVGQLSELEKRHQDCLMSNAESPLGALVRCWRKTKVDEMHLSCCRSWLYKGIFSTHKVRSWGVLDTSASQVALLTSGTGLLPPCSPTLYVSSQAPGSSMCRGLMNFLLH